MIEEVFKPQYEFICRQNLQNGHNYRDNWTTGLQVVNSDCNERFQQELQMFHQNPTGNAFNIGSNTYQNLISCDSSLVQHLSGKHFMVMRSQNTSCPSVTIKTPSDKKVRKKETKNSHLKSEKQDSKCELRSVLAKPFGQVESTEHPSSLDSVTSLSNSESFLVTEFKANETDISLRCFVCNMEFENIGFLEKHRKSTSKLFCRICTKEFSDHTDLDNHFKIHKPFKCMMCYKLFLTRKDLYQHRDTSEGCQLKVNCDSCNKTFSTAKSLRLHKRKYHSEGGEVFKCIVCDQTFTIQRTLNEHLRERHMVYEDMECPLCNALTWGPKRLRQHMKVSHINPAESDSFICTVCKKIFKTKHLLRNHQDIHDKTERLCEVCGASVIGISAMSRHKSAHFRTSYNCKVCNEQFKIYNDLRRHLKLHKDTVDEGYFCEICGKKFTAPNSLKSHKLLHSDIKQFVCDICGASFKQKVALRTHQRVHSDVGKYCCSTCGMSFKWKQTFDKHVLKCVGAGADARGSCS